MITNGIISWIYSFIPYSKQKGLHFKKQNQKTKNPFPTITYANEYALYMHGSILRWKTKTQSTTNVVCTSVQSSPILFVLYTERKKKFVFNFFFPLLLCIYIICCIMEKHTSTAHSNWIHIINNFIIQCHITLRFLSVVGGCYFFFPLNFFQALIMFSLFLFCSLSFGIRFIRVTCLSSYVHIENGRSSLVC